MNDGISASPADGRLGRQRVDHARRRALQQRDAAAQIEPQIERHLLVARSAGVQAAAGVAEPLDQQPLDEAVDVFVGAVDERRIGSAALEQIGERGFDLRALRRRAARPPRQRPRPRQAAGDVVFEQAAIETERRAEVERRRVGRGVEAARPEIRQRSTLGDCGLAAGLWSAIRGDRDEFWRGRPPR